MRKKKDKFVYLVYCNKDPIVYGCYSSKQNAVRYAIDLIRYRKKREKEKGKTFGYYHFQPFMSKSQIAWSKTPDSPYYYDVLVFTACLSIPEDKNKEWGDDACKIQVVRRVLR